jgi:hypothetical protein
MLIHIIQYTLTIIIKKIQNVSIIPCFNCERLCFIKQLQCFSNQLSRQLSIYFKIQIKLNSASYICTSCLHNISEYNPSYQVRNKISKSKIIPSVQKLTQFEEHLIHHILFSFKFINSKGMGNIRCIVMLLMSL